MKGVVVWYVDMMEDSLGVGGLDTGVNRNLEI
jgi:hypothetical protein